MVFGGELRCSVVSGRLVECCIGVSGMVGGTVGVVGMGCEVGKKGDTGVSGDTGINSGGPECVGVTRGICGAAGYGGIWG